jgi:hypothetical protein
MGTLIDSHKMKEWCLNQSSWSHNLLKQLQRTIPEQKDWNASTNIVYYMDIQTRGRGSFHTMIRDMSASKITLASAFSFFN